MILVTGGTGILGAHLLMDLCQKNPEVKAIKRASSDLTKLQKIFSFYTNDALSLMDKITWVDADLNDYYSIEDALDGVTKVYHCAAMVSFNKKDERRMLENNVGGTAHLVNACLQKGIEKLVHVSSIAALGRAEHGEMTTEKTPWKDNDKDSPYSISKYQSELEVWRGIAEGLNAVIINPSVILGPGEWSQGSPAFFSLIHKRMKFYSQGINGYVGVRDVSKIMQQLMDSNINGERFVVNAENLTYLELFNMMAKSIGAPFPSIEVRNWMLQIGWRLAKLGSLFTGKTPQFTRTTARSFMAQYEYSSEKLDHATGYEYQAMQMVIADIGSIFLNDFRKK